MDPGSSRARRYTASKLVERGWDPKLAQAWADHTGATENEILRWRDAGYTPNQARTVFAIAWRDDYEPDAWLAVTPDVDAVIAYTEAGVTPTEAAQFEAEGRPAGEALRVMRDLQADSPENAVRAYKNKMRQPADFEEYALDLFE